MTDSQSSIQQSLLASRQHLTSSDTASLDAQLLLCHVLGTNRAYLFAHPEQPLTPEQQHDFNALVQRAADGEPIAYILGKREFYGREFTVTPDVLIPRPETEILLESALDFSRDKPPITAVDVGTGSGAIAVSYALEQPTATVYATDISPEALTIARKNAERLQAKVHFHEGDLLAPLIDARVMAQVVMANLPYIAEDELPELAVSRYEPHLALSGGADGLVLIRRLLTQIPKVCQPGALILLETGADQGPAVRSLVTDILQPADIKLIKDYAGLHRIVRCVL